MTRKELVLHMLNQLPEDVFDSPIHITQKGCVEGYDIYIQHGDIKNYDYQQQQSRVETGPEVDLRTIGGHSS